MFFVLSKVFWALAEPANLFLLVLATGIVLLWSRWHRAARLILSVAVASAAIIAVVPIGPWMISKLEDRFPAPDVLPSHVDGIVVLGGVINPVNSAARGQTAVGGSAERLIVGAALARRYPDAKVVYTAGSGQLFDQTLKEAHYADHLFAEMGLPVGRVLYEDQSRNTFENAMFSKRIVTPETGETWLLVTSASHMPRAVGCFRKADWPVVPHPVDYSTHGAVSLWSLRFHVVGGFGQLAYGLREWIGLLAYRLTGRIDDVFPAPIDGKGNVL